MNIGRGRRHSKWLIEVWTSRQQDATLSLFYHSPIEDEKLEPMLWDVFEAVAAQCDAL